MSILISQNITLNTVPADFANRPRILVDNVFQLGTVSASSEVGADNGWLENAVDGGTYDWWEWSALPATLEVQLSTALPVDMCAIGLHTGLTFVFQYYDGADWVNLHEAVTTTTTAVHAVIFSEITASRYRINITAADDENILGIVMLGKSLQFPKGFYGGHAPITLNRTTQIIRNKTENGFDAGVYSLRTGAATSVEITNAKPAWIRENLESLNKQLEIRPFVFAWRPGTHPNDVAYCWLNSPITASNSGPRDYMTMQFDLQAFVGGGDVAPIFEYFLASMRNDPYVSILQTTEGGVTFVSSPNAGFSGEVDAQSISAHRSGLVAVAAGSSGARVWQYQNGSWDLIQSAFEEISSSRYVSVHPENAKWLLVNKGNTFPQASNLYKRITDVNNSQTFLLFSSLPTVLGLETLDRAMFSPDGDLITGLKTSSVDIFTFNHLTGGYAKTQSISIGQFTRCAVWDKSSTYLSVINESTFGDVKRLKIFKRDFDTNLLASLSIDVDVTNIFGANDNHNFADWSPDGTDLVIGLDEFSSKGIAIYRNNGDDTFSNVTESSLSSATGVGGRTYSVKFNESGTILLLGFQGGSRQFVSYGVQSGVYTRLYDDRNANQTYDIEFMRFSGSLPAIYPDELLVTIGLYDSENNLIDPAVGIVAAGTYTIKPVFDAVLGVSISSVVFTINEESPVTDSEAPIEQTVVIEEIDDGATLSVAITVTDNYNRTYSEVLETYAIDIAPPFEGELELLLGLNASPIVDESTYNRTVTVAGTVTIQSSVAKFGSAASMAGSSQNTIVVAGADLGNADFTLEFWVYPTSFAYLSGSNRAIFSYGLATLSALLIDDGRIIWYRTSERLTTTETLTLNAWNHVAFERHGNDSRIYINGVPSSVYADANDYTTANNLWIGTSTNTTGWFAGYIDEVRMNTGFARYQGATFTPPVAEYPRK